MKDTMEKVASAVVTLVLVMVMIVSAVSVPASADFNNFVGTWRCDNADATLCIYVDGSMALLSGAGNARFNYSTDECGHMYVNNGSVFSASDINNMMDNNGIHWSRAF